MESRSPLSDINNNCTPTKSGSNSPSSKFSGSSVFVTPIKIEKSSPITSPKFPTPKASPSSERKSSTHSDSDLDIKEEIDSDDEVVIRGKDGKPAPQVQRRNERERNRVKHINRTFSLLRTHLPIRKASKKLSKVDTLRSAVDYIKYLRQILADHDALTAAISLEQALMAHNQQQMIHQQQQLIHQGQLQQQLTQQQQQTLERLQGQPLIYAPSRPSTSTQMNSSLNSSLCSPTGPVNSPPSFTVSSPSNFQPNPSWDNVRASTSASDADLLDLAAESCLADINDIW